jgi:hypothetical protein
MATKAKLYAPIPMALQPRDIGTAINYLKTARDLLRDCGCKNAADKVRRALKSAEGAERHAIGMLSR